MISLLIQILVLCLIVGLVWWGLGQLPLPAPVRMVVNVVLVIIAIVALCSFVGWLPGWGHEHLRG